MIVNPDIVSASRAREQEIGYLPRLGAPTCPHGRGNGLADGTPVQEVKVSSVGIGSAIRTAVVDQAGSQGFQRSQRGESASGDGARCSGPVPRLHLLDQRVAHGDGNFPARRNWESPVRITGVSR